MSLRAAVIVVAVPDTGARAIRALARSRRATLRALTLRVARQHLHQFAPRGATECHALRAPEDILQLLQRYATSHRVDERLRRAFRRREREHRVVVPFLVQALRGAFDAKA